MVCVRRWAGGGLAWCSPFLPGCSVFRVLLGFSLLLDFVHDNVALFHRFSSLCVDRIIEHCD